ncbi:MAG: hypothetical protein EU540_03955 [Promethearchaeota archaeon]|nr:MAG: hypothetical protein EU540_03955 [Candidatus Lokiarchaeota archaeon]
MSFINLFKNVIRSRKGDKKHVLRNLICLFFILVFLLNFLFLIDNNSKNYYSDNENNALQTEIGAKDLDSLKLSQSPDELLQDPFTINFDDMGIFFNNYFKSDYNKTFYVSESKSDGVIIDNKINSRDNLLLYKSLIKEDYDEDSTLKAYLDLKSTPLWYQGNVSKFEYGFLKSINGSTGEIIDDTRYLVDNLMPIFLLIENIDDDLTIKEPYEDSIIEMFNLINSSEFWDSNNYGFFESNSSTSEKDIKSNLYAVLANLLIHRNKNIINDNDVIKNASICADKTMTTLINKAWHNGRSGFYNSTYSDWSSGPGDQQNMILDVNALGIIALLEYWIMNGMDPNSEYFKNATALYKQLSTPSKFGEIGGLWNTTYGAYEYYRGNNWDGISNKESHKLDLEANALMMQACLKLFEVTGNFSYYKRAFKIRDFIENYLYNKTINAYMTSIYIDPPYNNNTNINFHKNLKLCEAYLKASEIYNSVVFDASYDSGSDNDFTMNQDSINLTCTYAFKKEIFYFFNDPAIKTIRYDNITGASITYIFRYPNGTIFKIIPDTIINSTTNLIYPINSSLPFGDDYTIYIYANWTYFAFKSTTKNFNVNPGLGIDWRSEKSTFKQSYYQGEVANFSIAVKSDYNNNLTLNVSMIGNVIKEDPSFPINITFVNNSITIIELNITILDDAPTGKANVTFIFEGNRTIYLKESKEIDIKNAITYSNLIYSKKVVTGRSVEFFVDMINQSPNVTQYFYLNFSGPYCTKLDIPITLGKNEREIVSDLIATDPSIPISSIEIDMTISIGKEILYTEILTVEIVPSFEIISIEFPEKVTQGIDAHLVILIQNNQRKSEEFSLFINDDEIKTEIDELIPGRNRIEYKFVPTWNPYEFGIKSCHIEIEDDSDNLIVEDYFEYEIELSAMNLIFFYVVPVVVLIGIILHYKSKYLKHKLLRR